MRLIARVCGGAALVWIASQPLAFAAIDASAIRPVTGMVITSTGRSTLVSASSAGTHGYNNLDQETWTSVIGVTPEEIKYRYHVGAPGNAKADADAKKFIVERTVRRADIEQSTRMTLLGSTLDPVMYAGQTFAETSTKALQALNSGADVPFVLGINSGNGSGVLGGLSAAAGAVAGASGGLAGNLASGMSMLGQGRDYYRGTLRRVESGPVQFSVIVNGVRANFAAIHAAGTFTHGSDPTQHVEFWWLNNAAYPLTLQWIFGPVNALVTRIDLPLDSGSDVKGTPGGGGGGGSGGGSGLATLSAQLDKSCHAEVSGIYFNTGSAEILDESKPALAAVSKLINQSKVATLTIEGHTDNVGTAQYNQDLSEKRAAAVRQALVANYGVSAGRLTAKGYGLTRPVDTNDTPEGRSHNRRVELSRPCPTQK